MPRESQGREAWWAAVYGVAQSGTQLKRLTAAAAGHGTLFQLVITHRHYLLSFGPLADKIGQTLFQCHCLFKSSKKKKKNHFLKYMFIYLATPGLSCSTRGLRSLLWHAGSVVAARKLSVVACGIYFSNQGLNPGPLHWRAES